MRSLVLGGTGTLGTATIKRLIELGHNPICFSRNEAKQKELHSQFKIPCVIGDIRDKNSIDKAIKNYNVDSLFHFAALKHVDTMEIFPEESVKTNILGSINVFDSAEEHSLRYCVFSSTDKATDPINVYGNSKAIAEKIALRRNLYSQTVFNVYRWGNVIGSTGSILPVWAKNIQEGKEIILTHQEMTRFWIKIESAVNFMLSNFMLRSNLVRVPSLRSAKLVDTITALEDIIGKRAIVKITTPRLGEKLHESLVSMHDNYDQIDSFDPKFLMSVEEIKDFLKDEPWILQ